MNTKSSLTIWLSISLLIVLGLLPARPAVAQGDDPSPPGEVVKLVFIHHSSGENWLADDNGGLGIALGQNNYFVSDTNYGWGPDAIGDRTDIPNWLEWFRSENTGRYMDAVFSESGVNSGYSRSLPDPGGENQIVMFKSCFPNSNLDGSPDDPPAPGTDMTVANAKYVYNEILKYFITRPDKLFVVVTAPPVSDPSLAENARAFNQWLVNDWLSENSYPYANVAVFDFYNVLTSPDNHHRFASGAIEHTVTPGRNTSAYASGSDDDHPSADGNRKATQEFLPLLNIFYHRWKASAPAQPAPAAAEPLPIVTQPPLAPAAAPAGGSIDAFEAGPPSGTAGWEAFRDEATPTTIVCAPASDKAHGGSRSLKIDFNVAANSWATCTLFYGSPQDWSGSQGLVFYLHAGQAGLVFDVDLYAGSPDNQETYLYTVEAPPESAQGWAPIVLTWDQFHRADWEADAGAPFSKPGQVMGLAFGLSTYPDASNVGKIWVDDLQFSSGEAPPAEIAPAGEPTQEAPAGPAESKRGLPIPPCPCGGFALLPLGLAVALRLRRPAFRA